MKFLELQIKGFGKFHDRSIAFGEGVNVVYGKNEAGKSTIHTFIRAMLFGLQPQRGRAARKDLYSQYEPWENSGTYEGALRLEHEGHIFRIERTFRKDKRELRVIDETLGKEVEDAGAFMGKLLGGMTETAYNNTISIGQLKSATDAGMVSELKNYIANMNTSGNMSLNITKASAFLKAQKKELEDQLAPEAARSYASLLGEVKSLERDTASPEYENQLPAFQKMRMDTRAEMEQKQAEKEDLLQKAARGRQLLEQNHFTDTASIDSYEQKTEEIYSNYIDIKKAAQKPSRQILSVVFFTLAVLAAVASVCGAVFYPKLTFLHYLGIPMGAVTVSFAAIAGICASLGVIMLSRSKRLARELAQAEDRLADIFRLNLGDADLSSQAMDAFRARMEDFRRLSRNTEQTERDIEGVADEIAALDAKELDCGEAIERQQKLQWELEKKLELLAGYKDQLESLKGTLAENQRLTQEIAAIDLAQETMTDLSMSIRDSFGLYLNKTASDLIAQITGGAYTSMSIDENLNAFMNTKTKLVPVEQVSSGTMDQIYLALRLAAAKLIQGDRDDMPLIFDDSFVLYDDERLKSALRWLTRSYGGQIIIFTCHQREAQMLTANQIEYRMTRI